MSAELSHISSLKKRVNCTDGRNLPYSYFETYVAPMSTNVMNFSPWPTCIVKFGAYRVKINPAQFLVNLYQINTTNKNEFVFNFENDFSFAESVFAASLSYFALHVEVSKPRQLHKQELFRLINKTVLQGVSNIKHAEYHRSGNTESGGVGTLKVKSIESSIPVEPDGENDDELGLNSMKFPKPKIINEITNHTTGRPMGQVLLKLTSLLDNKVDSDLDQYYDELAEYASNKTKVKYAGRNLKVSTEKRKYRSGESVNLNTYAQGEDDNFGYLPIEIESNSYKFLLDSGAMASFISKTLVTGEIKESKVKVATAGSAASSNNVAGTTTVLLRMKDVNDKPVDLMHVFIVLFDCNGCAGIIGQDILNASFSMGLDFEAKVWKTSIRNEIVLIPYSSNRGSNLCTSEDDIHLLPREARIIQVQCHKIMHDIDKVNFINDRGLIANCVEILPSVTSINKGKDGRSTALLQLYNGSHDIVKIDAHTILTNFHHTLPKDQNDVQVSEEAFLSSVMSRSLNFIITDFMESRVRECPELNILNLDEEVIKEVALNSFFCNDPNLDFKTIPKGLQPNLNDYNEYAASLDHHVKDLKKNVISKDHSTTEQLNPVKGYADHISDLEKDNPDLVLPDDYLSKANAEVSTVIGDTEKVPEVWSIDDISLDHIPSPHRPKYERLMKKYKHIFSTNSWDIGCTDLLTVKLDTTRIPTSQKQRHIPASKMPFVHKAIEELKGAGIIKKVNSWDSVSNIILVPKYKSVRFSTKASNIRADESQIRAYRMCIDLRDLNQTLSIKCPSLSKLPENIIRPLANQLVTNLDVTQAYFSIPLDKDSQGLTSFFVDNAVCCFLRLSQGLLISPRAYEIFNTIVYDDKLLEIAHNTIEPDLGLNFDVPLSYADFIQVYQDDSWLHSDMDFSLHLYLLHLQFAAISRSGLKLSPGKCKIARTEVTVLGLNIDTANAHLGMDILKSQSILSWPDPSSLYELHSRLYSLLYYSKFLPKVKQICLPLQDLLRRKEFVWGPRQKQAWEEIKTLIILDIRLYIPHESDQLYLFCDASKVSCACILAVQRQGSLKIVGTDSTIFNYSDSLKSPFVKEAIGLVRGLKKFKAYIGASTKTLIVFTDCRALLYISRKKEYDINSFNLSNFLLFYQSLYSFNVYHVEGITNLYADLCSRVFANSRLISNLSYNLSKVQADILPPLQEPFLADCDLLYQYLASEPRPEKFDTFDKSRKRLSVPRPLSNLAKLYDNVTPEERYVASLRLLRGWDDASLDKLEYTEKLNKKLGLNNLNVSSNNPSSATRQSLGVIFSHPWFTKQGMLLAQREVRLQANETMKLGDMLHIKCNVLIQFFMSMPAVYVEISPVTLHKFSITLCNRSGEQVRIMAGDVIGYLYSNVGAIAEKLSVDKWHEVEVSRYVIPFSGLSIDKRSVVQDLNLDGLDHSSVSESLIKHLNSAQAIKGTRRAAIADTIMMNNNLPKEVFMSLQKNDEFCNNIAACTDKEFKVIEGIWYKCSDKVNTAEFRPVIPTSLMSDLLDYIHLSYGHPTFTGFLQIFGLHYFHVNVRAMIKAKIKSCVVCCKLHEQPRYKIARGTVRSYLPTRPRESVSMDIIPKLLPTEGKMGGILLLLDNFSRYGSAILIKDKTEREIVNALKNFFLVQGVPQHLYSDSEVSLISAMQYLQNYFDFIIQTSPAQSQYRNRAENGFKDLKGIIKRVLYDPKNQLKSPQWDIALAHSLSIYNRLPFKRNPLLTRELIHYNSSLKTIPLVYLDTSEFSSQELDEMVATMNLKKIKEYEKDKQYGNIDYKPGMLIYARGFPVPGENQTFTANAQGPYKIITVDANRKEVKAQLSTSSLEYCIPFANINKIALDNVDLGLFTGFLTSLGKRDFNSRPRKPVVDDKAGGSDVIKVSTGRPSLTTPLPRRMLTRNRKKGKVN